MPKESSMKVFVRVRPFVATELKPATAASESVCAHPVVDVTSNETLNYNPSRLSVLAPVTMFSTTRTRVRYDQRYQFDRVFDQDTREETIFDAVARPMIEDALAGNNATMFAYGATGCGKSHTVSAVNRLTAECLFARLAERANESDVRVELSYVELYNEKLIDLLPAAGRPLSNAEKIGGLGLRDGAPGGTEIVGLAKYAIGSPEEFTALCARGDRVRCTAATQANSQSSRSHALLTLYIDTRDKSRLTRKRSTLTIIDLAGSERALSTRNRGQRLAEGASINKSLLALGKCINARARKQRFVPYRESKLTRLLRSCLDGECTAAMIICISPSLLHFDETHYSLEYGQRASCVTKRKIQRKTWILNRASDTAVMDWASAFVARVRKGSTHLDERLRTELDWTSMSPEKFADLVIEYFRPQNEEGSFRTPPLATYSRSPVAYLEERSSATPVKRVKVE